MSDWTIFQGLIVAITGLLSILLSRLSTRETAKSDTLSKGAETWKDLGEVLRKDLEVERKARREAEKDLSVANARNELLESVVKDLQRWIKELSEWENKGSIPPPPYTWRQLLQRSMTILEYKVDNDERSNSKFD